MPFARTLALLASIAVGGGCAGGPGLSPSGGAGPQAENELDGLDCGRITGRMQIRILSLRNESRRSTPSALSRGFSDATSSVGLSKSGSVDPGSRKSARIGGAETL